MQVVNDHSGPGMPVPPAVQVPFCYPTAAGAHIVSRQVRVLRSREAAC